MMTDELAVVADGAVMGRVYRRGNRLAFNYDPHWRESADSFPLSLSLPLVVEEHGHRPVEAFLWGLLPDNAAILQEWGKRFHVSPRNPFKIIEHVGEDCAGAVQFVRPDRLDELLGAPDQESVTWLTKDELNERIALLRRDASATRYGTDTGQFSLAGAQPKTAFFLDWETDRWGVPAGRTPTTHILKPAMGEFDGQAENEHFCLLLAAELGLATANSWVMDCDGQPAIVVERYDRMMREGRVHRIHQEDLCQALAVLPHGKYQNQGGPSPKQVAAVLWEHSSAAVEDVRRFADSLILSWLISAPDAHAKNLSLLHAGNAQVRLAPLYDIVSSIPYPRQIQPRKVTLAMRIGSKYRVADIRRSDWERCASELRLPPRDMLDRIEQMIDRIPSATEAVGRRMAEKPVRDPIIPRLVEGIAAHVRTCREQLGSKVGLRRNHFF